jgi:hypothetical protein
MLVGGVKMNKTILISIIVCIFIFQAAYAADQFSINEVFLSKQDCTTPADAMLKNPACSYKSSSFDAGQKVYHCISVYNSGTSMASASFKYSVDNSVKKTDSMPVAQGFSAIRCGYYYTYTSSDSESHKFEGSISPSSSSSSFSAFFEIKTGASAPAGTPDMNLLSANLENSDHSSSLNYFTQGKEVYFTATAENKGSAGKFTTTFKIYKPGISLPETHTESVDNAEKNKQYKTSWRISSLTSLGFSPGDYHVDISVSPCSSQNNCKESLYFSVNELPKSEQKCTPEQKCDGKKVVKINSDCSKKTLETCQNSCSDGECSEPSYPADEKTSEEYADCDGLSSNGKETDLFVSMGNCGACNNLCGLGTVCDEGKCSKIDNLVLVISPESFEPIFDELKKKNQVSSFFNMEIPEKDAQDAVGKTIEELKKCPDVISNIKNICDKEDCPSYEKLKKVADGLDNCNLIINNASFAMLNKIVLENAKMKTKYGKTTISFRKLVDSKNSVGIILYDINHGKDLPAPAKKFIVDLVKKLNKNKVLTVLGPVANLAGKIVAPIYFIIGYNAYDGELLQTSVYTVDEYILGNLDMAGLLLDDFMIYSAPTEEMMHPNGVIPLGLIFVTQTKKVDIDSDYSFFADLFGGIREAISSPLYDGAEDISVIAGVLNHPYPNVKNSTFKVTYGNNIVNYKFDIVNTNFLKHPLGDEFKINIEVVTNMRTLAKEDKFELKPAVAKNMEYDFNLRSGETPLYVNITMFNGCGTVWYTKDRCDYQLISQVFNQNSAENEASDAGQVIFNGEAPKPQPVRVSDVKPDKYTDLRIEDLKISRFAKENKGLIKFTLVNEGTEDHTNIKYKIWTGEGSHTKTGRVEHLDAGSSADVWVSLNYHEKGSYKAKIVLDPFDSIDESNEKNNNKKFEMEVE